MGPAGLPREELPWDRVVVSVVIPVYNQRATVLRVLERVREVPLHLEVIVVDDGSTDGTRELLPSLEGALIDRLVMHERNRGKGAALRTGFAHRSESTRLNSSHVKISYAVFCLKK